MGNYALVKDGFVINTVIWDGESQYDYGQSEGVTIFNNESVLASTGDAYIDGILYRKPNDFYEYTFDLQNKEWVMTEASKVQKAKDDTLNAESTKSGLLDLATKKIGPLQDAVDLDMATDEEKASLLAWKKYRVLVNRVDTSTAPNITWPDQPTE